MKTPDFQGTGATEAHIAGTSLDPYGQLIKMLLPRALSIGIHDATGMMLWISDGANADLLPLVEEALTEARKDSRADGMARVWDGDPAYIFLLRDDTRRVLGAVAVLYSEPNASTIRPFSLLQGLLRPALEVLARELANQLNIGDLQRDLSSRDGDLELLAGGSDAEHGDGDDFTHAVRSCVEHLNCTLGALIIPDKNIFISCTADGRPNDAASDALARTQKHLLAWSQVQKRTVALNKAPPAGSPIGALPYKILACPILRAAQHVLGILVLFKPATQPDFDLRQIRIIELLARRISYVLQNAYDLPTGLLSRTAFEKRTLALLHHAESERMQNCVAYGDIDRLHVLNENHGMHVGDEVIARIAEVIRSSLGARMVAARISGDRFALFMPDCSLEGAEQFVLTLCRGVSQHQYVHDGKTIELSISFGIASVVESKKSLSHVLAAAEVACKAAKDRGRGRVEVYQEADHSIVQRYEDVMLVGTLREALASDNFRLEAQPVVLLGKNAPGRRFELLLRMIDTNGQSISPGKFLLAAERYQLASAIDRWVVQFVLEFLSPAAAALQSLGAHFAVNLSGQSLGDEDFPAYLEAKLRQYSLPPTLLSFEVTETAAVANIVRAEMLIRQLQHLGHHVALDDFGRGLSSLTYLKSLPVSHLKIDGGLVRDVVGNSRSQAMVSAIVQIAQAMKLKITAECVENEAIQNVITQLGVHYGQGFHIGRPRPLEDVLQELLREAGGGSGRGPMGRLVG